MNKDYQFLNLEFKLLVNQKVMLEARLLEVNMRLRMLDGDLE